MADLETEIPEINKKIKDQTSKKLGDNKFVIAKHGMFYAFVIIMSVIVSMFGLAYKTGGIEAFRAFIEGQLIVAIVTGTLGGFIGFIGGIYTAGKE